jgi:adenine-specific DNA-methyltransferase
LRNFYKQNPELKGISMYDIVENDPSGQRYYQAYRLSDISAPKASGSSNNTYEVKHPITGLPCKTPTRGWGFTRETMNEHIKNNNIYFYKDHNHVPQYKRYLHTVETEVVKSIILDNTDGKKELIKLFGFAPFENAKPTTLIKNFIRLKKNATILDFFAGSGTTGHAVYDLNKEDKGSRQFILCTNNENKICEDVTYPRLKKVGCNLNYLKTSLIPHSEHIEDFDHYNIAKELAEMIGFKEQTINLQHNDKEDYYFIFTSNDNKRTTCVYYKEDTHK